MLLPRQVAVVCIQHDWLHGTELKGNQVIESQLAIVHPQGREQDHVGGGKTIHQEKLYHDILRLNTHTHHTFWQVNGCPPQSDQLGTVFDWYHVIDCQTWTTVHQGEVQNTVDGEQTAQLVMLHDGHKQFDWLQYSQGLHAYASKPESYEQETPQTFHEVTNQGPDNSHKQFDWSQYSQGLHAYASTEPL